MGSWPFALGQHSFWWLCCCSSTADANMSLSAHICSMYLYPDGEEMIEHVHESSILVLIWLLGIWRPHIYKVTTVFLVFSSYKLYLFSLYIFSHNYPNPQLDLTFNFEVTDSHSFPCFDSVGIWIFKYQGNICFILWQLSFTFYKSFPKRDLRTFSTTAWLYPCGFLQFEVRQVQIIFTK